MVKTDLTIELPKSFKDVLYLSGNGEILPQIKKLLKQQKLSYVALSLDKFHHILYKLDLIGTVIIDAKHTDIRYQQQLAKIIESLEMRNIGAILIGDRLELPVKSFSLAGPPVKSFALTTTMESVSLDELWVRISINLAYRKKSAGIIAKPPVPPPDLDRPHTNKLAEQLRMTGVLVDNLAEQLRMAGLVQRDFLPTQLPDTDKIQWATIFLPAEWVSGDIYDIVRIDEQHIGFYVADAIGHSMPAALLTIFLKQALVMRETFANSYNIFSPDEVMKNLNVRMAGQKLSGYQFATCCYCLLNINTLELTYARAGHPYPVLLRPGSAPQQLEARGSLLGIFQQAEYVQQKIQLRHGDKLILYSDGAEPFMGNFDEQRGFNLNDEFCEIINLPVVEMMDRFNALIQNKKIGPTEVDDITVVGLEIR
jgi:sigma-B regulation protein RsbU (phosphoserine phosphatase)